MPRRRGRGRTGSRQRERGDGACGRDAEPSPVPPPGDHQRYGEEDARVLGARREPGRDAGPFEPTGHRERERDGDSERQWHVGHCHVGVRHVRRRDRRRRACHPPRGHAVGSAAEPDGGEDAGDPQRRHDEPSGEVRRVVEERLERRKEVDDEAGVVVPTRVERPADADLPRARHDALLVRVEQRERQPVADAVQPERGRDGGEDHEAGSRRRHPVFRRGDDVTGSEPQSRPRHRGRR